MRLEEVGVVHSEKKGCFICCRGEVLVSAQVLLRGSFFRRNSAIEFQSKSGVAVGWFLRGV